MHLLVISIKNKFLIAFSHMFIKNIQIIINKYFIFCTDFDKMFLV